MKTLFIIVQVVIAQTSKLLEEFYPEHVLQRLRRPERAFWDDCHLEPGDWQGFCRLCFDVSDCQHRDLLSSPWESLGGPKRMKFTGESL